MTPEERAPSLRSLLGNRILIIGSTNAGKTTLGARLALELDIPHVELDALNWQKDWVGLNQSNPEAFRSKISQEISGSSWVVTGNYFRFSQELIWPHAETIIWLDLPLPLLTGRLLRRSWRRWRSEELLWGNNTEQFWPQLAIWNEDSLLRWLWKTYSSKRTRTAAAIKEPRWSKINFVHLRSQHEVDSLPFAHWTER